MKRRVRVHDANDEAVCRPTLIEMADAPNDEGFYPFWYANFKSLVPRGAVFEVTGYQILDDKGRPIFSHKFNWPQTARYGSRICFHYHS